MISAALQIMRKDLNLILLRSAGIAQALLLGLLLIFLFSLSLSLGERLSPQAAATMFWLSSMFCQVLIFQMLYALEESNGARIGLLLLPIPVQSIWLGKFLAGFVILCIAQLVFIPAMLVFLGQNIGGEVGYALLGLLLVNVGICACGSLLGALGVGHSGKESLLSIVLFPTLLPLLLAGISLFALGLVDYSAIVMAVDFQQISNWLGLAVAFDAIFLGAGILLFPFLYTGDYS